MNFGMMILKLLCKVNKVTSYHRHGQHIPKRALDDLSNFQIEFEEALRCKEALDAYARQIQPQQIQLGMLVYHKDIYHGQEQMKVIGIREKEIELEGDYSGGTHCVCQSDWKSREGVLSEKPNYDWFKK